MNKNAIYKWLVFILLLVISGVTQAQVDTTFTRRAINYKDFLASVARNNLDYGAEKFNLNIAEAGIEAAKVFPDPELALGASDKGEHRMRNGYGVSTQLSWLLELGGKRSARIQVAKSQAELSKSMLEVYFRNLRADVTVAYLTSLKQKGILQVMLSSYSYMKAIADADSIRFKLGSISDNNARQSKVEANSMLNEVYQSEADWKTTLVQLDILSGKRTDDSLYAPTGDFLKFDRDFDLKQLVTAAENNRADLAAALQNKTVSQNNIALVKASRMTDLGLSVGAENASIVSNIVAPTASNTTLNVGISMPLKFSNKYKGDLRAATYSYQQADVLYKNAALKIQNEVVQAWYNYKAMEKQVHQFNQGLLADAKKVLEGKVYSYKRGETTLLEVLNAKRTYNETQLSYYETIDNHAKALVELEKAAGIWDINF